jgi:hypothetical protein
MPATENNLLKSERMGDLIAAVARKKIRDRDDLALLCTEQDLLKAGFTTDEIELCGPLARSTANIELKGGI